MIEKWPRYATRQNISLSINWMAPLAARLSPPHSFRIFVGYPSAAWTVSHEKLTPGPGPGETSLLRGKLSNWLVKSAKVYMLPGWMDFRFRVPTVNALFTAYTYSPGRLNPMRGKKKKWKKRGRRGIFARVPFPLTSLREKKSPTRLFKYRIAVKKEIYLTLAFLFGRPLYRDPIISYFVAIILIFNI